MQVTETRHDGLKRAYVITLPAAHITALRDREDALAVAPAPVIVLTADGRQETRRNLLTRGANLVLFKPAKADALIAAVNDLLDRHAA